MPHLRIRHLKHLLTKSLTFSPIVGVFGHRQVGKTVLTSSMSTHYVSLDLPSTLSKAETDPFGFIVQDGGAPFTIDECQLAPVLFPVLKEYVRTHKKPGQFILTGSVRFSSRKAIRESLTGRLIAWELLPMDVSEQQERKLPDALAKLIKSDKLDLILPITADLSPKDYVRYLEQGGLPGAFAVRDPSIRRQRFETQLNTLLERDLKLITQTSLGYRALKRLTTVLASQSGQPLDLSFLSRETRISRPTLNKLISAFEAIYLIRVIPTEDPGASGSKRPVLFFEDLGEANYLANIERYENQAFTCFLYANLRVQFHYRPELAVNTFQFRTRGGALVPLCFRHKSRVLGIIPSVEETPSANTLASARSFLKAYRNSRVLVVHRGVTDRMITKQIRVIGCNRLL